MVDTLQWLALETKYLDRSQAFYEAFLDLSVDAESESSVTFDAGGTDLVLREPGPVPRGGVHTHYAFAIPAGEYDDWFDRLDERFDLVEHSFGDTSSLYFYDPDGNCVELGQSDVAGPGIDGIFEVVLEVESLDDSLTLYEDLGFEVVDQGEKRRRVRMTSGSFALELWEPQRGIADARGGLHVDFGVQTSDPEALAERVADAVHSVERLDDGRVRLRDPDGHYLTLVA